ncbi:ATP-binding protein [Desulfonatronum thioautotrophicum]|uniref:ATP-binding protein n=1 Tax=Desulfonatronum thioautotrophicum TaxID=617001 RepID=UPI0005EB4229|nr:ATP-binding protein [Desulfonatronum thioautotrophicum]
MQRIHSLIQEGESQTLEYKLSFGREAMETLCAFANAKGGSVLIGVDSKGRIKGVQASWESVQQWINQLKGSTSPSIVADVDVFEVEGKTVVELSTFGHPIKPISFKGKYFTRKHNSNHLMTLSEIANEHLNTLNLSWDFAIDPRHGLEEISLDKVNAFVAMANALRDHPITDDPLTVLRKFELLREGRVTLGCFLLFCREPSLISTIDAGRFDSETIIRDGLTIRDDLFSEVEACMGFVRKHISKRYLITDKAQRTEVWEYPLEAVREVVINMIVHRDYRASADSTLKIFNDRMELFNPGTLPEGLLLEDILAGRSASNPRNKQIAGMFKEAGLIEKYGSGIVRVHRTMLQAGAPAPHFEPMTHSFKVTLFPISFGGVSGRVNGGVNGGVNGVFSHIQSHPGQNTGKISKALGLPKRTVERRIREMKGQGLIEFRGAPKTGGYYACRDAD